MNEEIPSAPPVDASNYQPQQDYHQQYYHQPQQAEYYAHEASQEPPELQQQISESVGTTTDETSTTGDVQDGVWGDDWGQDVTARVSEW